MIPSHAIGERRVATTSLNRLNERDLDRLVQALAPGPRERRFYRLMPAYNVTAYKLRRAIAAIAGRAPCHELGATVARAGPSGSGALKAAAASDRLPRLSWLPVGHAQCSVEVVAGRPLVKPRTGAPTSNRYQRGTV